MTSGYHNPVARIEDDLSGIPTNPSPPAVIPLLDTFAPGHVIADRYEIRARLGAGGMGAVFRAHDRELGEDIALKVLLPERLSDPSMTERFRREVKITRKITHPNVCRIFDLGEDKGLRFLTMELVEGKTLRALLAEGHLEPTRALTLLREIIAGVSAAHAQGVIHRDLKPENVLVRDDGQAVVADFGLARSAMVENSTATAFAGTPSYMSPEQLRGEPLDARSDIFSLGIVAYELFAGCSPFGKGAPATIASAILRDPPRPLEIPELPGDRVRALGEVLSRALAKEPEERFATATNFGAALEAARVADGLDALPLRTTRPPRQTTPDTTHETQREVEIPTEKPHRAPAWTKHALIAFVALVLLVAWLEAWRHLSAWREADASLGARSAAPVSEPPRDQGPSVAVLSFDNLTGEATWDGLTRSAAEAVRAGLRTMGELHLVEALPEGAREDEAKKRGVTWLVGGSVQRVGPHLRLTAQLRPLDGAVAGEPIEIDGAPAEPGKLLDALRRRTRGEARLLWQFEERRRWSIRGTTNESARAKLLQYQAMIGPRPSREHFEVGKRLLDEALAADASYVPALVERAFLFSVGAGANTQKERLTAASDDIDHAVTLAPGDAHALVMRCRIKQVAAELVGYPSDRALDAAVEACGAALAADPKSAFVRRAFARIYDRRCQDEQAMDALERILELDQGAPTDSIRHLAGLSLQQGRLLVADRVSALLVEIQDDERRLGARALSRRAGNPPMLAAHLTRATVLTQLGRREEAWDELMRELDGIASGISDSWSEAAAIRGLMRLAPLVHKSVPAPLIARLEVLEREFKAAMAKNASIGRTVGNAYSMTAPNEAIAWLDGIGAPKTCEDAIDRFISYHRAGDDAAARRALEACKPTHEWEKACVTRLGAQLAR